MGSTLNPVALRMAKTLWSFGFSECNRVKGKKILLVEKILSRQTLLKWEANSRVAPLYSTPICLNTTIRGIWQWLFNYTWGVKNLNNTVFGQMQHLRDINRINMIYSACTKATYLYLSITVCIFLIRCNRTFDKNDFLSFLLHQQSLKK